ncbi:MAG TPA: chemotaxis protein CheW [Candidatus Obscuribacterales bacterium]
MTREQDNLSSDGPESLSDFGLRLGRSSSALTVDQFRAVLKQRAKTLAQEEQQEELSESEHIQILQFLLSGEIYAFEAKLVREVRVAMDVTPIPCTPAFVAGVVNLRGEIVTVLDTKLLLGLPREERYSHKLIIVRNKEAQMAFLIDDVIGVAPVSIKELQPALPTMPAEQARRIAGLTGDPLVLIDVDALMNDPRILVEEEVFD